MTKPKTHYVAVTVPAVVCTHKHETIEDAIQCPDRVLFGTVLACENGVLRLLTDEETDKEYKTKAGDE